MRRPFMFIALIAFGIVAVAWVAKPPIQRVGDKVNGATVNPSGDLVHAEGKTVYMPYRPVQVELLKDGSGVVVLHNSGVSVYDLPSLDVRQTLSIEGGASMTGCAISDDGKWLAASGAGSTVYIAEMVHENLTWKKKVTLQAPAAKGAAYPCGLAWSKDGTKLWVCASRSNQLLEYSTADWHLVKSFDTSPAPFEVDINTLGYAYVACWSRMAVPGEETADASGTKVPVDDRGIVKEASIDRIDLETGVRTSHSIGRQPTNFLPVQGSGYIVPCANDDSLNMLSIDGSSKRLDLGKVFGKECSPTWVAMDLSGKTVAATLGRVNQLALFKLSKDGPVLDHAVNTDWYPAGVTASNQGWLVVCTEGDGSRSAINGPKKRNVYDFHGSLSLVPFDNKASRLAKASAELPAREGIAPVPVPERVGEPSVFKHVIYVLKENRTYDQVFGDVKAGEGSTELCDYPLKVTPNQHKLVSDFVLLDNYYCNGILSADGHAWAMEAHATSYFEKTFGGWTRSYPYGDDPLSVSSSGFIWNDVLGHGKSFRNYGEFDYAATKPNTSWKDLYKKFQGGGEMPEFTQNIGVASLKKYTRKGYPGWNLGIPDVVRASIFLSDVKKGVPLADFTIVYLPQDHTSGDGGGSPEPNSMVADNDLALGRVVDGISHSKYWKDTCIFANEDDPQAGYDHIDGHRSLCLVVSAYTVRNRVVSRFYNQTSALKTMERILGIPPMNRMDAGSPLMTACFTSQPNFKPFDAVPNTTPLDKMNGEGGHAFRFDKPDLNDDLVFNQVLWHKAHGVDKYPGRLPSLLNERGLVLNGSKNKEDDDE